MGYLLQNVSFKPLRKVMAINIWWSI